MFQLKKITYKDILDIDYLNIPEKKITSIVGESGCGKTTLMLLLNKMRSFGDGDILFNHTDLREIDAIQLRRRVVMLPQVPIIFPGTIKDNLLIGLAFSEKPLASDTRLLEVLQMVKLNKDLTSKGENLSGGEKQRLAIARVILMDPDVLLLDEPSSALDDETEEFIISQLVTYIKKTGKTMVMVTHSKKMAQHYSDFIVEFKAGKILNTWET